ncbi:MAG: helix-turn-helix transcriptional regulator, partial [Chloroflexota bacterium]
YKDYFNKLEENPEYQAAEQKYKLILDLADEILRLRMEKGWSQTELAERAGTKQANISRLESGLSNPSVNFLQKLAEAFEADLTIRIEKTSRQEIYIHTDAGSKTQEAYLVINWPKAKKYETFEHSSS